MKCVCGYDRPMISRSRDAKWFVHCPVCGRSGYKNKNATMAVVWWEAATGERKVAAGDLPSGFLSHPFMHEASKAFQKREQKK